MRTAQRTSKDLCRDANPGYGEYTIYGLAYYRYMFCAENRQILAIVDWPVIGVNSLQRCSTRMTYKAVYKV